MILRAGRDLLLACHPLPCVAVTGFAAAWAVAVAGRGRAVEVAVAVLLGQLSIGWGNDALDAARDRAAGRPDKPLATGRVSLRMVAVAAGLALVACVPASLALGLGAGLVHLMAVVSGWTYNLLAKSTVLSPVPFAVSFGLLPSVVEVGVVPGPPIGVSVAAALLGVGAHFANTVGDTEADALTGVRGLPQRLGPGASLHVAAACLAVAAGLLHLTTQSRLGVRGVLLGAGALLAAAVAVAGPRLGRRAFVVTVLATVLVVAGYLATAPS